MTETMSKRKFAAAAVLALLLSTVGTQGASAQAAAPVADVDDATVTEGDSGSTNASFRIFLSSASNQSVTVRYSTTSGTATAGVDYTSTSGSVVFAPGETQKTVTVPVLGDTRDEPNETFFLVLNEISGGTFGSTADGTGTIVDNDATPTISVTDASVTEGNSGTATTSITVSLSAPSGQAVSVAFTTTDGTATFSPGSDFHRTSGTLVFQEGETSKTILLTVVGDTVDEADEVFYVDLSSPSNATLADSRSTITILDDDGPGQPPAGGGATPTISISDASVTEGNSGTVQTTVTVSLSRESTTSVAVSFTTADNTATFSGSDFHSQSGRLVFAPGETSKTLTLTVVGDSVDEANETFFVNLSDPSGATIADGQSVVTIVDDDTAGSQPPPTPPPSGSLPTVSITDASVLEGTNTDTKIALTVSLSKASESSVSVRFATVDGTARFADADFWSMSGSLVFAPGETTRTITATVVGDTTDEVDEVFYVDLSSPTNATIGDGRGVITIRDDDGSTTPPPPGTVPTVSIGDASVQEGNADTQVATLTLVLSSASTEPVGVDLRTVDGTAKFADADYFQTSARIVFEPGQTSQTLQINVIGDELEEGDENFFVDLSAPINATIGDGRGVVTILDDDGLRTSATRLAVLKRPRRLVATGSVSPAHPGIRMRVVLKKRRDGRFRTVAVHRPILSAEATDGETSASTYSTRFKRPRRGRCLIKAIFPGDQDHGRSVAKGRFRC